MVYFITFHYNNVKLAIYMRGNIYGLYHYLENIWSPTTFTTTCQSYCPFGSSSSTNNDIYNLHPVILYLCVREKTICKYSGIIRHKTSECIICGPNFFPPSHRRKMKQFNTLNGYKPTELQREWNIQPQVVHFKSCNSPPKTSPLVSATM